MENRLIIDIIDYGLGNINAFYEIYKENGIKLKIIDNYKDLKIIIIRLFSQCEFL